MKYKISNPRKFYLRILFYSLVVFTFLQISIEHIVKNQYPNWLIFSTFIFLIIVSIPFIEVIIWLIIRLLLKIGYFESDDNKKIIFKKKIDRYKKDIRRFVIIIFTISILLLVIDSILTSYNITPKMEPILNPYLGYILNGILLFSLWGMYLIKKWGLDLYIITLIIYQTLLIVFDYQGLQSFPLALLILSMLIYFPYVRRPVFEKGFVT